MRLCPEGSIADNPIQITKISRLKMPVDFHISSIRLTDSYLVAYAVRAMPWDHINNVIFWYKISSKTQNPFPLGSLDLSRADKIENHDSFVFEFFHNNVIIGNTQLKEPILRVFELQEAHLTLNSLQSVHLKACGFEYSKVDGSQSYKETIPLSQLLMSQEEAISKLETVGSVQQVNPQTAALWIAPLMILCLIAWKRDEPLKNTLSLQAFVPISTEDKSDPAPTAEQTERSTNTIKLVEHSIMEQSVQY